LIDGRPNAERGLELPYPPNGHLAFLLLFFLLLDWRKEVEENSISPTACIEGGSD
jgi:hypothetical protein